MKTERSKPPFPRKLETDFEAYVSHSNLCLMGCGLYEESKGTKHWKLSIMGTFKDLLHFQTHLHFKTD